MLPWLETERASSSPAQRVPAPAFPFGADRRYFAVNPGIFFLQHATALLLPFGSNIMCQGRGPPKSSGGPRGPSGVLFSPGGDGT